MIKTIFRLLLAIFAVVGLFNVWRPLPDGVSFEGAIRRVPEASVKFLFDATYVDAEGVRHSEQEIFSEVFRMIEDAREYVLLDFFLYNSFQGKAAETARGLSGELTDLLVRKKSQHPNIKIAVITDPINAVYGGFVPPELTKLKSVGIPVILTDLKRLRDSNPIYSSIWRTLIQWFGNSERGGLLPHPFSAGEKDVTLRSWLDLLNFKANHRKLIVTDFRGAEGKTKLAALVTSGNPHDASSSHSNVAVRVDDFIAKDAIATEQAVGSFSDGTIPNYEGPVKDEEGGVEVQLLTEGKIRKKLLELIKNAGDGDTIDLVMFYLADRGVVNALLAAAERGAKIRLVLDPNRDAFGHQKIGIPNRQVASELVKESGQKIKIRWCDTHGEQCHSKLVLLKYGDKADASARYAILLGSANLTRRNIKDYNLETDVLVISQKFIPAVEKAYDYMERIWNNRDGKIYTVDYKTYEETGILKWILYWIQEQTGLSSF